MKIDDFSDDTPTVPSKTEVEGYINDTEGDIEEYTNRAWREVTITNELYDYDGLGCKLKLQHSHIRTFNSDTDKLEVADHSTTGSWKDFIADYTESTTIGDSNDFYVDYNEGVIYFKSQQPSYGKKRIRMTYRYGESTVPKDIKKATILLVKADMAEDDRYYRIFPQPSEDNITLEQLASRWRARAYKLLDRYKEPNIDYRTKLVGRR